MTGSLSGAFADSRTGTPEKATVFFLRDISGEGLRKLYARVNQGMPAKSR
jgi:hypothetical protein